MTTIVNFVPAYKQAPVASYLLSKDLSNAAKKINALHAEDNQVSVILPQTAAELKDQLQDQLDEEILVVFETLPGLGFVYQNDTAAFRVLEGEKPLPSAVNGSTEGLQLIDGGKLLAHEGKRFVWFEGKDDPVELFEETTIKDLVDASGVIDAKGVYVGYPNGQFFSTENTSKTIDVNFDYVCVYGSNKCMAQALNEVCQMYRHETCGRCVFGHEGSHQTAVIVDDICRNKGKASDIALLRDLCPTMQTQSLCEMGRIMGRAVLSALDAFGDEIEQHFTKHICVAGECSAYVTYHILPNLCIGCGECIDACEEEAILGKPRFVHVIDQKACTQCGKCVSTCEEEAIIVAGADKPRTPPRPIPCKKR